MENKGQFLLYDALMATILILILVSCVLYMTQLAPEYTDYNSVTQTLETLSDTNYSNTNVLTAWSNNNNESISIIDSLMRMDNYRLKDLTTNKTLTRKKDDKNNSISSQKIINEHVYELTYYY